MTIPSLLLTDKVAIVTGARRGIGEAIALTFAEAGADVVVCDVVADTGELKAVADEIQRLGRRSLAVQTDISQKLEVERLLQKHEFESQDKSAWTHELQLTPFLIKPSF